MTVSNAVAKKETGGQAIIAQYRSDFGLVLPSHIKPETWVRLAQGTLRRNKQLALIADKNPASLMQALLECARLGHEPGTEAFYLVPMGGEIEGWEGYRGVIDRMYRAGAVISVKAEIVRANDVFDWRPNEMDKPLHQVDWFGDRGEIVGAYAYADLVGGNTSRVVVINKAYLEKVKAQSKGSTNASSPWVKWEEPMTLKTVIHRLEPFVPTSSEYREAMTGRAPIVAEQPTAATPPAPPARADLPLVDDRPADEAVIDGEVVTEPESVADFTPRPDFDDDAWLAGESR